MKRYNLILLIALCFFPVNLIFAQYELERQDIYDYKEFFDDLYPIDSESTEDYNANACGSSSYVWPIGSETTKEQNGVSIALDDPYPTVITSYFGSAEPGIHDNGHGALDIAPSADAGVVNVIAAIGGEVVYVATGCQSFEGLGSTCGGGYGNHVVIKSDDGNYEYYAHMHQNTVTVNIGDKVVQGQVLGKVGSSGRSTGTHLHFEMREGEDTRDNRVDPQNYVDINSPRPSTGESCDLPQEFLDWIAYMEGGKTDGDYYVAYAGGDYYPWTIGPGLTLGVSSSFEENGIDPNSISVGTRIEKSKIWNVYITALKKFRKGVEDKLAREGITMNNNQILTLTSSDFNGGGAFSDSVIASYKQNGDSYKVFQSFCEYVHGEYNGVWSTFPGLIRRRKVEWLLYTSGIYLQFDTQSADNGIECIGNFNVPQDKQGNVTEMLKKTSSAFNGTISYY